MDKEMKWDPNIRQLVKLGGEDWAVTLTLEEMKALPAHTLLAAILHHEMTVVRRLESDDFFMLIDPDDFFSGLNLTYHAAPNETAKEISNV